MPDKTRAQALQGTSESYTLNGSSRVRTVLNLPSYIYAYKGYLTSEEIRRIRIDPTVKLARMIVVAPALQAGWSVESDKGTPPEIHTLVEKVFVPLHTHIMRHGMLGNIDYGWTPFEKVWGYDPLLKIISLHKLKHLLQSYTEILVDKKTGAYTGLKNWSNSSFDQNAVELGVEETLLLYQNVEGTNWYGESDLIAVHPIVNKYDYVETSATRYDNKMAGGQWVLWYPRGKSNYNNKNDVDNAEIASDILDKIESNGKILLPRQASELVQSLNDLSSEFKGGWELEYIEASGTGNSTMVDRLKYLDALKVRAFGIPERSVLEGSHGTKAEAGVHGDFALTNIAIRRGDVINEVNWHLVNHFIRFNFGPQYQNTVRLVGNLINDASLTFAREAYQSLLSSATVGARMQESVDLEALAEKVNIPLLAKTAGLDRSIVDDILDPALQTEEK